MEYPRDSPGSEAQNNSLHKATTGKTLQAGYELTFSTPEGDGDSWVPHSKNGQVQDSEQASVPLPIPHVNPISGYGWFGGAPDWSDQPVSELLEIARSGNPAERVSLAGAPHLPVEVMDVLSEDSDEHVAAGLASNEDAPPEILARVAKKHPKLRLWVASQSHAPPDLKDLLAIGEHTGHSIERYLDDVDASSRERLTLLARFNTTPHREGPPLGDVWRRIREGDVLPVWSWQVISWRVLTIFGR